MEKNIKNFIAMSAVVLVFGLAGCAGTPEPTIDPNLIYTQAAATVQAQLTETAAAMPTATPTLEPTATPVPPTATPTEVLPTLPPVGGGDQSSTVATATIVPTYNAGNATSPSTPGKKEGDAASWGYNSPGDNETFKPNEDILLAWGFVNTGTTTWKPGYKWVFSSGQEISGVREVVLDRDVKPGEKWEASIRAFLPGEEGTYISRWYLYNNTGAFIEEFYFPFKIKK